MSKLLGNTTLLIVNYNLPERVYLITKSVKGGWIIVDNGSDIVAPHPESTHFVDKNNGWINGLVVGLEAVKTEFVWVFTTSMGAVSCEGNAIAELQSTFTAHPEAVTVSPAWLGDLTAKTHKVFAPSVEHYRENVMCSPAAMWRTNFLRDNLNHNLIYGWGADLELGYIAKQAGFTLWVNNRVGIDISEHAGYSDGRRNETLDEVNKKASQNMEEVLSDKYGKDWKGLLGLAAVLDA